MTFIRVVPLVSRRWAAIRNAAAASCHRLELEVLDPEEDMAGFQPMFYQVLIHNNLPPKAVRSMAVLFTAIRELKLILPYPMPHVVPMLESWSETLAVLIVSIDGVRIDGSIEESLFNVINTRLFRLSHLYFCDAHNDNYGQIDLSVLSRLMDFQISTENPIEDLFESLHRYACGNDKLNRISIWNRIGSRHVFDRLSREFPPDVSV